MNKSVSRAEIGIVVDLGGSRAIPSTLVAMLGRAWKFPKFPKFLFPPIKVTITRARGRRILDVSWTTVNLDGIPSGCSIQSLIAACLVARP